MGTDLVYTDRLDTRTYYTHNTVKYRTDKEANLVEEEEAHKQKKDRTR